MARTAKTAARWAGKKAPAARKAPAKMAPAADAKEVAAAISAKAPEVTAGMETLAKKAAAKAAAKKASAKTPAAKPLGKRAAILAAAQAGKLPEAPDWTKRTHYREVYEGLVSAAKAGDLKAIEKIEVNAGVSQLVRYRELAIVALKARKVVPLATRRTARKTR